MGRISSSSRAVQYIYVDRPMVVVMMVVRPQKKFRVRLIEERQLRGGGYIMRTMDLLTKKFKTPQPHKCPAFRVPILMSSFLLLLLHLCRINICSNRTRHKANRANRSTTRHSSHSRSSSNNSRRRRAQRCRKRARTENQGAA